MWTEPLKRVWCFVLIVSLFSITSCGSALPPDEVETLLEKQFSDESTTAHFECNDGESGWNYICEARYERTSSRFPVKTTVQRVGVKLMGTVQGTPGFGVFPIPDGRTLSAEELADVRKAQAAEASQKPVERM